MNRPFIIIGAGGHAKVIADSLLAGGAEVLGFTDIDGGKHGHLLCGLPVIGDDSKLENYSKDEIFLANGFGGSSGTQASFRRILQRRLEKNGWHFSSVIHPSAIVSPFASLGSGVQIMAGCIVQPGVTFGSGVIVNTSSIIEHDVSVGDWTHIAPGAVVCGGVKLGPHVHLGAGATVKQGLYIGPHTVVGAGAVVIADFDGDGVLVGVPAREAKRKK